MQTETRGSVRDANVQSLTLDELLDRDADELSALYERASTPRLRELNGDLEGRMLASPLFAKPVAHALRVAARWEGFPWRGKSFVPPVRWTDVAVDARGVGYNRLVTDRVKLFRFETYVARSRAGDFDAVHLDYDNASNPRVVRRLHDELRTLRPGLYLGQGYVRFRGAMHLVVYFGLADRAS